MSRDTEKCFQTWCTCETRWVPASSGIEEESQGSLSACSLLSLCVCMHVCSNKFVCVCVRVCWKAHYWMSTFNRPLCSLNANENKEREIVGTLKQWGKNQQSETEKAKPYSAKGDFIRFSSPPLEYMAAINPALNVFWAPLFMGSDNDSEWLLLKMVINTTNFNEAVWTNSKVYAFKNSHSSNESRHYAPLRYTRLSKGCKILCFHRSLEGVNH